METVEIEKRRVERTKLNELSLLRIVFEEGKKPVNYSAMLADISLGGMRLLFPAVHFANIEEFSKRFRREQKLFIAVRFKSSNQEFALKAIVRWAGYTVGYDSHPFSVGLEFAEETELPATIGTIITVEPGGDDPEINFV